MSLARLARIVLRHRLAVVVGWLVLSAVGAFSAAQVSDRFLQEFSIPGYSAYEANKRTLETFGSGAQAPLVAVVRSDGDVTQSAEARRAVDAAAAANPGARVASFFSTGSDAYVSEDRHVTFATIHPTGVPSFTETGTLRATEAALEGAAGDGVSTYLTGTIPIELANGGGEGAPSVVTDVLIGGTGALIILLFVFGTLPAVAMPLIVAAASILNCFTLVWGLTYLTDVSLIVQFLIALIGLGIAIDYSLLMIFRFREELAAGRDVDTAIVETMRHAGHSVIVSGSTVAIGLFAMVILPVPFLRSMGLGGMLIPLVSVLTSLTLLPALLATLGHRIDSLRVMPRRLIASDAAEAGFWARWSRLVLRRPVVLAAVGVAIVVMLLIPASQLNPSEPEAAYMPGRGGAIEGRDALSAAGLSAGVQKPLAILVEGSDAAGTAAIAAQLNADPDLRGAVAPPEWQRGSTGVIEAFAASDGSSAAAVRTIDRLQETVLPALETDGVTVTLGGVAAEARDFYDAVYGNAIYVIGFVVLLTFLLLARAFRSLLLPLKAVILNLVSLGAAYGIVVFIFQEGNFSEPIWGVEATQSIVAWVPIMIFAFLYGISMDYEVFMLTRMREIYDETGDTRVAVSQGLARTGKLVTSASLILMCSFFVLSTGPEVAVKQVGIGLAAGIVFDATVIRALLVPALMTLMGRWNWWLPPSLARLLLVRSPRVEPAREAV